MSRPARAAVAGLALAVLAGGVALPLLGLALAEEPAPFCCRDRCCCTGEPTHDGSGVPCLRAACRCGEPDAVVIAAPLRIEAVLPAVVRPVAVARQVLPPGPHAEPPLGRPDEPPVPPPKTPLPA